MCTKFYQNRLDFVEDMTKTFCCVFFSSQCVYIYMYVRVHKSTSTLVCKGQLVATLHVDQRTLKH